MSLDSPLDSQTESNFDQLGADWGRYAGSLAVRNLEAKFRLGDLENALKLAQSIGYELRAILRQQDTFFKVPHGKLKLRDEQGSPPSLIYYGREERDGSLQLSSYEIVRIGDAGRARAMLSAALGAIAEVRKERTLLIRGNIRLHLDRVEGLGDFGEIEAVIADDDDPERSRGSIDELLGALGVTPDQLIDVSYFELAAQAAQPK